MRSRMSLASSDGTISTMPMPQLNTRSISASTIPPRRCSQSKIGGRGQRDGSIRAWTPFGNTRGTLPGNPPPVMCATPLSVKSRIRFRIVRT